jgi:hypothetical protein
MYPLNVYWSTHAIWVICLFVANNSPFSDVGPSVVFYSIYRLVGESPRVLGCVGLCPCIGYVGVGIVTIVGVVVVVVVVVILPAASNRSPESTRSSTNRATEPPTFSTTLLCLCAPSIFHRISYIVSSSSSYTPSCSESSHCVDLHALVHPHVSRIHLHIHTYSVSIVTVTSHYGPL